MVSYLLYQIRFAKGHYFTQAMVVYMYMEVVILVYRDLFVAVSFQFPRHLYISAQLQRVYQLKYRKGAIAQLHRVHAPGYIGMVDRAFH